MNALEVTAYIVAPLALVAAGWALGVGLIGFARHVRRYGWRSRKQQPEPISHERVFMFPDDKDGLWWGRR